MSQTGRIVVTVVAVVVIGLVILQPWKKKDVVKKSHVPAIVEMVKVA